jgi:phosphoglycerate dehydrogenase-like enzyme
MKALITCPRGITFDTFFPPSNIEEINRLGNIIWNETDKKMTADEIAERISDCDTYVTVWGSHRLDESILKNAPKLKLLTHLCGTVVPFVSDEMWERGIRVISGNDWFAHSVAEGVMAYMLAALRDIPYYSARMRNGGWKDSGEGGSGLFGKRVGIVAYGSIAKYLVRLLQPFGVKLAVYHYRPLPQEDIEQYGIEQVGLDEIFSGCDIISLHAPLLDATYHMIGEELLRRIKPGALFINTARGAVVDEAALVAQLATGRFRAVLDVYEKEPLPQDSPLRSFDNVLLMPHMAGPTIDLRSYIALELMRESAGFIDRGEDLLHEITRDRAEKMSAH